MLCYAGWSLDWSPQLIDPWLILDLLLDEEEEDQLEDDSN
jgi:hypothetical protein